MRIKISLSHLEGYFQGFKEDRIATSDIRNYITERLEQRAKNGTINRELTSLRLILNLAFQDERINRIPYFPKLKEADPRQGFFENEQYLELLKYLSGYLSPVVTFAYHTGWRKNEILNLKWEQVDLKKRYIYLNPDQTKNNEARSIYIEDELCEILKIQKLKTVKECPYVFHNEGKKIGDFRKTWKKACKNVGIKDKLFNDFRRKEARNLTRSGMQETVAMKITGYKTRSVFDCCNITNQEDIREAAERQESYLLNAVVTKSVTIEEKQHKSNPDAKAQVVNFMR